MPFNSFEFVFSFLPVTVTVYWLLVRGKMKSEASGWLLLCSVAFYLSASPRSFAVVLPSILLDYGIVKLFFALQPSRNKVRAALIILGIVANLLCLGYFKYRNFFLDTAGTLLGAHFAIVPLFLPLGISFLTFQKIGFLGDVLAEQVTEIRFMDYLLFTLFFPRTVAGPIVHYKEVVPQIKNVQSKQFLSDMAVGFCLFAIGLFKKCVLADSVAQLVPLAFEPDPAIGPSTLISAWSGVLAYVCQLYFDFSGYSDMALGAARMLGVRLPMNFNSPLKSTSVVEYWSRWHITLTRFLTWHIYIPLVRRLTRARASRHQPVLRGQNSTAGAIAILLCFPTFVTMLVSGIWHGAGWQFVFWGILQGFYLSVNQIWRLLRPRFWPNQRSYERVMKPVGFVLTFGCVTLALVFFRADSIRSALSIIEALFGARGVPPYDVQLLQNAGYPFDWTAVWVPGETLSLPLLLLAGALLLPNSLELLRRFGPALDFPQGRREETEAVAISVTLSHTTRTEYIKPVVVRIRRQLRRFKELRATGISLDRLTAALIGILFALGVMAMGHGGGFIYGQF